MTANADCAALAPVVSAHSTRSAAAGGVMHTQQLAQAGQILAGIGSGATTAAQTSSAIFTACAQHCGIAANRAGMAGDFASAASLRSAQEVFTNLAAGI